VSTMTQGATVERAQIATYPALGILAVLLGAMLATFLGRLISVGIGDLRGALHFDFGSGSWVSTSYNMGLMFIGPFSVYLGGIIGSRRVLLACAGVFSLVCCVLPLGATHLSVLISLLVLAGLTAGTFYPLTLSFLLRNIPQKYLVFGIGAYAMDIVITTHVAHSYEAWLMNALSWRWIFWTPAVLAPLMMFLVYFGIPRQPLPTPPPGQPRPSWRGFLYASAGAALVYGALDQGQRLDWWRSSLFTALAVTGLFLILVAGIRHFIQPNPMMNFKFLGQGNTLLLGMILVMFRFGVLATVVLVPSYLASAQGYTAEQTGPVLLWVAVPQIVVILLAVILLARLDSRLILATGFILIAYACICNSHLTSAWSGVSFRTTQLVLATGEAFAFTGLVGTSVLEVTNSGSLNKGIDVLTFAGFFQTLRLFGGEVGSSFIQFFLQHREQFHSNVIGLHVERGAFETAQRYLPLAAGMLPAAGDPDTAAGRGLVLLALTVRKQAFTLAVGDSFLLIAFVATVSLLVIACMTTLPLQYKHLAAAPAPAAAK
jgi:DHA2 family multidrug resistance protein